MRKRRIEQDVDMAAQCQLTQTAFTGPRNKLLQEGVDLLDETNEGFEGL